MKLTCANKKVWFHDDDLGREMFWYLSTSVLYCSECVEYTYVCITLLQICMYTYIYVMAVRSVRCSSTLIHYLYYYSNTLFDGVIHAEQACPIRMDISNCASAGVLWHHMVNCITARCSVRPTFPSPRHPPPPPFTSFFPPWFRVVHSAFCVNFTWY